MIKISFPAPINRFDISSRRELMENISCIYFIYSKYDKLLYVGKTNDLKNRISYHMSNEIIYNTLKKFKNHFSYVKYVEVNSAYEREIYETFAINFYKPVLNTQKVYLYDNKEDRKKWL